MAEIEHVSDPEDAERLLARSHERPVLVFKHSVTCGISAGARRRFESFVAGRGEGDAVFALLEVQHARPLSNALAEVTGVRHQSPQAILLRGGEAVWDASHGRITEAALGEALDQG